MGFGAGNCGGVGARGPLQADLMERYRLGRNPAGPYEKRGFSETLMWGVERGRGMRKTGALGVEVLSHGTPCVLACRDCRIKIRCRADGAWAGEVFSP